MTDLLANNPSTEPTKVCAGPCGARKPWSAFCAKVKWPDGSTRQPQSRCKTCRADHARECKPDRTEANRRYWLKLRRDTARYQDHLERRRFRYHIERGSGQPRNIDIGPGELLDTAPFVAWLQTLGSNSVEIALVTGLDDRVVRRYLSGETQRVSIDVVDRACLRAGSWLDDVYPLELEAA